MISDNGTTFIAAAKQLTRSSSVIEKLNNYMEAYTKKSTVVWWLLGEAYRTNEGLYQKAIRAFIDSD